MQKKKYLHEIVDYLIIGSFILLPNTFLHLLNITIFNSPKDTQLLIFSFPLLLIIFKLIIWDETYSKKFFFANCKYLLFFLYGVVVASFTTQQISYQSLKFYIVEMYWVGLVVTYIIFSRKKAEYHINLIRLFFLHIAVLGVLFYFLYGFVGFRKIVFSF